MSLNPKVNTWRGQRVWLVGASSGIGEALAIALAKAGAHVAISARRADKLSQVLAGLSGDDHLALSCDVSDPASLAEAHAKLLASWGGLDFAMYLAGDYQPQTADDFSVSVIRHLCEVNYLGAVSFVQAALPLLSTQRSVADQARFPRGLVLVGSVAAYRGLPKALGYGPSKAALANFADALYLDLGARKLGVWLVSPGFVDTPLTAQNDFTMPALISPQTAADEILAGMASGAFEIHFPKRFTRVLKLLRLLPDRLYFALIHRITGL